MALHPASKPVTDLTEQCAAIGDLRHALAAGAMPRSGESGGGNSRAVERGECTAFSLDA